MDGRKPYRWLVSPDSGMDRKDIALVTLNELPSGAAIRAQKCDREKCTLDRKEMREVQEWIAGVLTKKIIGRELGRSMSFNYSFTKLLIYQISQSLNRQIAQFP